MVRCPRTSAALVVLLMLTSAAPAQQPGADTSDGLRRLMLEVYASTRDGDLKSEGLIRALRLPSHAGWFARVFGEPAAAKLTAEYGAVLQSFEADAAKLFAGVVQKGQSDIRVVRFTSAGDPAAVGNQRDAMAAMTTPTPLYSVRFVQPGEKLGMHLYSFVHADGGFRFAGRMTAAKP